MHSFQSRTKQLSPTPPVVSVTDSLERVGYMQYIFIVNHVREVKSLYEAVEARRVMKR
jgi:hypothetical protein